MDEPTTQEIAMTDETTETPPEELPGTVSTGPNGDATYTPTYDEAIAAGYSPDAAKALSTPAEPPTTDEPKVPDPMAQDSPVATFPDTVPPAGLPGDFGEVKDPANDPPEPKVFSTADLGGNPPEVEDAKVERTEDEATAAAEADAKVADEIAAETPEVFTSAAPDASMSATERKIRDQSSAFPGETATERKLREMGLTDPR